MLNVFTVAVETVPVVFNESDDVFHEHVLWDVCGPLLVGVGVAVAALLIRRLADWLGERRRRRRQLVSDVARLRRSVSYLLECRSAAGDREAKEILNELQRSIEEWR